LIDFHLCHIATDQILTADSCFRGVAEVTGPAACSSQSRSTHGIRGMGFAVKKSVAKWTATVRQVRTDYVVIDTPPSDEALAASMALAHVAVIPSLPSGLDLEVTRRTLNIVNAVRRWRTNSVHVILAPNRVASTSAHSRVDSFWRKWSDLAK
jgi:cellulose biosynthesis protein BcsQ